MFDTIKRLILPTATLHCPRCEKSLTGHDDAACARRMSRRFFFQVAAGAAVVVATPEVLPRLFRAGDVLALDSLSAIRKGNRFLTTEEVTHAMLEVLHNNLIHIQMASKHYDAAFSRAVKIGETIQVRRPPRYLSA